MANIFNTEDSVFFVGGVGAKTGLANAGGCTKAWWGDLKNPNKSLTDIMGTDGAALIAQTACTYTHASTRITKAGAFTDAEIGMVAYISGTNITTGRYKITAVDVSGDYVDVTGIVATGDNANTVINIGGAFTKIQEAADNTTASAAAPNDVFILTNKPETFSGVGDEIDIDTGGGAPASNTKKYIIGIGDNGIELFDGYYTTIDGNNVACHVFYILDIQAIEFRHIYAYNSASTHYGFYIHGTDYQQGFVLDACKSTDCKNGIYSGTFFIRGITVIGGFYSSNIDSAVVIASSRWVHLVDGTYTNASNYPIIDGDVVGTLRLEGCILYKTGPVSFGYGVRGNNWDVFIFITHCTFYNVDVPIDLGDAEARVVEHSNIFVLHTAASVIINVTNGVVMLSDYSCAWSIEGAPTGSNRWSNIGIGPNSIEADPLLSDPDNLDFRLELNSPCLDTGRPTLGGLVP
jgi:hypothetical protein